MTSLDMFPDLALLHILQYWEEREARLHIACADCQFEYVEEDGHNCGER